MNPRIWLFASACTLAGCGSTDDGKKKGQENPDPTSTPAPSPGVSVGDDEVVFQTAEFTVDPGKDRFLCYAANVGEDLTIEGYHHEGAGVLHHVVFSRATVPEPDGFSECDTLFRITWEPLYLSGAGASTLDFPEGLGHQLETGAQLVAQLHLLNTTDDPVTEAVAIRMRRSKATEVRPVGSYAFGNMNISLPPSQPSSVEGECDLPIDVELIAAFPHMHLLGKRLTFEVAPAGGEFAQVFERDPYDFDDQRLEPLLLTLHAGDRTRVRCEYDNPYPEAITFGESTTNEMCFLVGFAADRTRIGGCGLGGGSAKPVGDPVPVDPTAGVCGEHTPTADGVGLACTKGGGECPGGLECAADYQDGVPGICFSTGCDTSADCGGERATCCAPAQGGGLVRICVPEACRTPSCVPVK